MVPELSPTLGWMREFTFLSDLLGELRVQALQQLSELLFFGSLLEVPLARLEEVGVMLWVRGVNGVARAMLGQTIALLPLPLCLGGRVTTAVERIEAEVAVQRTRDSDGGTGMLDFRRCWALHAVGEQAQQVGGPHDLGVHLVRRGAGAERDHNARTFVGALSTKTVRLEDRVVEKIVGHLILSMSWKSSVVTA